MYCMLGRHYDKYTQFYSILSMTASLCIMLYAWGIRQQQQHITVRNKTYYDMTCMVGSQCL